MRKRSLVFSFILVVTCLLLLPGCKQNKHESFLGTGTYTGAYWPTAAWKTCKPEEVGMDSDKLYKIYEYAANPDINTRGLVIIRRGYIVGEAYFEDFSVGSRFPSYSIAKSFLSSLFGIAIDKGFIENIDEQVTKYLVEWLGPEHEQEKQRMTIRHLLTMSSGLEWNEEDYYNDQSQNDVFLMAGTSDYLQYVLEKTSIYEPGTRWYYSSGDSMLLSGVLERAVNMTAYAFALEHLLRPIGADSITWDFDPAGHTIGGWGVNATVREYAKFGYLYLRNGEWDGQQVVSRQWVEDSTGPARDDVTWYGFQWWLAPALSDFQGSIVPPGTFIAWGIYTQQIFVIPGKDIVMVRVGRDSNPSNDQWREVEVLTLLLQSLNE